MVAETTSALGGARKTSEVVLSVSDLAVDFPTEDGMVHAVRGVTYDLHHGEVLGIVGESGSGKSVSSMALMGLLPKTAQVSGSAKYRGDELLRRPPKELNQIRGRKIVMIFQDPMTSLNPVYRVGNQIAEAIQAHSEISKADARSRAVDMLQLVGIPNPLERSRQYPHEYSGGMRQRAMIAMAIANDPDIIIADEPTTALDVTIQAQVLETLVKVQEEFGSSVLLITHDLGVVAQMADRVLVMYAGRPVEIGTVDQTFRSPRMPYTVGLLGSLPRLDEDSEAPLVPIKGSPPSLVNLPPGCPFQPRCPLAAAVCNETEPDLRGTEQPEHLAACHFVDQLAGGVSAEELFVDMTTSDDLEAPAVLQEVASAAGVSVLDEGQFAPLRDELDLPDTAAADGGDETIAGENE